MQTLHDFLTQLKIKKSELAKARNIANLFKIKRNDGKIVPGGEALTEGQLEIFYALVFRPSNRININCCTQYGKSLTVALACVYLTTIKAQKVAVVAPSDKKTRLVMRYYIEHLGDCLLFSSQLEANTRLERLRQEGSKERIILRNGGGIYTISAQAANSNKSIEAAMGEGAESVIEDESCLIPDETEATIFRMISGKGKLGCYIKIGNPFYRDPPYEHFYKSSYSTLYLQIFIDYKQAIAEGRYSEEFIDEARDKPMFEILYECKFPEAEEIDDKGYRRLLTLEQIRGAMVDELPEFIEGNFRLGADIGRGGNFNAYVGRDDKFMWLHGKNRSNDLMTNVREIEDAKADSTFIDDTGVGGGVTDRCIEKSLYVVPIKSGGKSSDTEIFANLRAEMFFKFKQWLLVGGGKLEKSDDWLVLYEIKWKVNSSGKFMIEPKDEMMKRAKKQLTKLGSSSPDVIDAGSFTFGDDNKPQIDFIESEKPEIKTGILKAAEEAEKKDSGL